MGNRYISFDCLGLIRYDRSKGEKVRCRNHPGREAIATCQKYETGFCGECCACLNIDHCCECVDPKLYCKFRTQCLIWEMSRDRRKKKVDQEIGG